MAREDIIKFLIVNPYKFGHLMGFDRLTTLHNSWIKDMVFGKEDMTLQAHRGSYKTTCVSIALALLILLYPNDKTIFIRKTDDDVKEIIKQTQKILISEQFRYFVKKIYDVDFKLTTATAFEISSNLTTDPRGVSQIVGAGSGGSLTGKHFDRIFTDDIVNLKDRFSKSERERTKSVYQELQNIKNRGGRIFNTGTPWHADDCFTLMPNIHKYDCYSTHLISDDELQKIKSSMTASLFAANYELRHIAAEDVIFTSPQIGGDPSKAEQGECHIDAAYGGEDYTAFTICKKSDGKFYIFGKLWRKHIDDVLPQIIEYRKNFNAGRIYCEINADKGYLAKDLKTKGERVTTYHENMNKFIKITTYLKAAWKDVIFVQGTDDEYINQICDFNENADHDDAPDSAASIIRKLWSKDTSKYEPLWNTDINF